MVMVFFFQPQYRSIRINIYQETVNMRTRLLVDTEEKPLN